jgi:predicted transcriptional regulator of viral defense system
MPITHYSDVYELAEPQHGYLTTAQAEAAGIRRLVLTKMAKRGVLERISTGVYRLANFPPFAHGQLLEASLWPLNGVRGVVSHESALSYYGLSDVNPSKVHITIPVKHRVRRSIPKVLVVHHADLPAEDLRTIDGITITTARRAIIDSHQTSLGPALIRQAIEDGSRKGWLTSFETHELSHRLLAGSTTELPANLRSEHP